MSVADNKARVQRFYDEVWARGNLDAADDFFADEYERHDFRAGDPTPGPEGQKQIAAAFRSAFPDLTWDVDFLIEDGDLVAGRWTASGTHLGPWAGVEPTGRAMRFSGINVFRFADGKVVEEWIQSDMLGLLQQAGVMPGFEA